MKLVSRWTTAAAVVLAAVLAIFGAAAHAQEFRGTISGQVNDPSGAAIPGADVTVREINTGTINKTKSDAAGQYVVPFLLPGSYEITVTAAGFEKLTQKNIDLQSQAHPIVALTMQIGEATQTVTVTTAPPLVNLADASVGSVIDTAEVADLPLNGRTPVVLQELAPGVIATSQPGQTRPFDNNAGNSWSMGGTPNQVSEILLDGSPDLTLLGALAYSPTQDSVQEVAVRPFDTDASFGHTIGGVVNQVTKSGTNAYHGTVYEFNQIPNIDANPYFNKRTGAKTPTFHFNQYGLTFGGPVRIPKLYNGTDKLFFFFAYERLKDSQQVSPVITTVPTDAERKGDFSQTLAAGCTGGAYTVNPTTGLATCNTGGAADPNQLYNPFTATLVGGKVVRTPIANNLLTNADPLNTIALAYQNLYPEPNDTVDVKATGQSNFIANPPQVDTYHNEFGRLDFNLSSRDHMFFDMRHNFRNQLKNDYFNNGATGTTLVRENFGASFDNVFTVNPTTVLDVRLNWTLFDESHGTPAQKYTPTSVGLPAGLANPNTEIQLPLASFGSCSSTAGGTSFQCLGDNTSAKDPTNSYQAFADVVKVLGRHTVKVGFDGRQYRLSITNYGNSSGEFITSTNWVTSAAGAPAPTFGGDYASFLLGLPTSGQYDIAAHARYTSYYIGSFVQDDWRINDKLTLNLGVRFDIDTPYNEASGRTVSGFNPTAATSVSAGAATAFTPQSVTVNGQAFAVSSINTLGGLTFPNTTGSPGAPYNVNSGFFSPRFGFSYSPHANGSMVVRGGFGIFVQPATLAALAATGSYSSNAIDNQEGFSQSTTLVASTSGNYLTPGSAGEGTLSNPFPNGFLQPVGSTQGASTFLGQAISFLAPNQHDPYSERWNLGLQQSLGPKTLFEMLYQGNHAVHLPVAQQNLNAVQPQYLSYTPFRNQNLATAYGTTVANPFAGLLPNSSGCNGATTLLSNLLVKYPQFCNANVLEQNQTIGSSNFHSLIFHIEQKAIRGLTLTSNYSFSKLIEKDTFLNDQDTHLTKRVSPFDHTNHFVVGATYNLPFGKDQIYSFGGSRLWNEVLGGFTINTIYSFQTGAPIYFSSDLVLQPGYTAKDIRVSPRVTSPNVALNTSAFVIGSATCAGTCDGSVFVNNGTYVNHYRTLPQTISSVRQDGINNMDASILKNFALPGKASLQFRFETFNTLNHAVFAAPNVTTPTTSAFGIITAPASSSVSRQVQMGARLVF